MKYNKRNQLKEATSSGAIGKFKVPVVLSPQIWKDDQLGPFTERVYSYDNAELAYEEADGDFKHTPAERKKIEARTDKIAAVDMYLKKFYTGQNDEEGSNIGDLEVPKDVIKKVTHINEDLAVWFGTKKKPKGSKQPKGPWVNICKKDKNGKHPPCGRPEAKSKGYPKCRAVHVASKMSSAEKKNACVQKRKAEKKEPKVGKGNKPTMTSYKPRRESIEKLIKKVINEIYDSSKVYPIELIYSNIKNAPSEIKKIVSELNPIPCQNEKGERKMCFRIPEVLHVYFSGRY